MQISNTSHQNSSPYREEQYRAIYQLMKENRHQEAFSLLQEIRKEDPDNPYLKRSEDLIRPFLNDASEVGKIATVKAKNLKCPHCQSAIALSALNTEQREKIRANDYSNLSIKCPYCHTTFTLQKKTFTSVLGIKIGDTINYSGEAYRVTGAVSYLGHWYEDGYSGALSYLEWILVSDKKQYLYFSEGYAIDDDERVYEFEFSQKIVPNFSLGLDGGDQYLWINEKKHHIEEENRVRARGLYGENSKVFTVGENINLFEFSYQGKNYVLEKEQAGRQQEAGIYETKSVSHREACNIFQKAYTPLPRHTT